MDPSRTRQAAQGGNFASAFFKLPKDVKVWFPEKKGTYDIDILGYEATLEAHPDRKLDVAPGTLWWRMPFVIFRHVGVADQSIVSAASVGEDCPMMEEYRSLAENYKDNKQAINDLQMQKWMAFAIRDPDDEDKVAVFASSIGKFWGADAGLKNELDQTDESNLEFYEYGDGKGRTLRVRFSDIDFTGGDGKSADYLGATKIEFVPREDLDESEWIDKVPALDAILNVRPYDEVKRLWLGIEGEDGEKPKGRSEGKSPSRTTSGSASGKPTSKGSGKKDEEPEEDSDQSEEEDEQETEIEEGDVVSTKIKGKKVTARVTKIDGDDAELEDDNGKTYDAQVGDLTLEEKADPDSDSSEEQSEEEPEEDEKPKGKSSTSKKRIPKVGDKIEDDQGNWGEVIKVDAKNQDVTVKRKTGKTGDLDFSEVVKYLDEEDGDEGSEESAESEFEVSDKVTWNKGKSSGVITRIMGDEAKVKNDDGSGIEQIALSDLKPKKGK